MAERKFEFNLEEMRQLFHQTTPAIYTHSIAPAEGSYQHVVEVQVYRKGDRKSKIFVRIKEIIDGRIVRDVDQPLDFIFNTLSRLEIFLDSQGVRA